MSRSLAALTLTAALVLSACAPTAPPAPVAAPASGAEAEVSALDITPAYHALFFDEYGLHLRTTNPAETSAIVTGARPALAHTAADTLGPLAALSPDARHLATAYHPAGSDSTVLLLVEMRSGAARRLDAQPVRTIYSAAWRADGVALAFGRYEARGSGDAVSMGRGGVYRVPYAESGEPVSVGCSASKIALRWRPDGRLLVGGASARYVVEPEGCGTVSTFSLEKKRAVSFSPDGMRVAYVTRELEYERAERAYVADTTFFLAEASGAGAFQPLGSSRIPRSLDWHPGSQEIALDTEANGVEGRTIAVYTFADSALAFLMPPQETGRTRETEPMWSPSGRRLAFEQRILGDTGASEHAIYSTGEIGMNRIVHAFDGPTRRASWVTDDVLVLIAPDGRAAAISVANAAIAALPSAAVLLGVVPAAPTVRAPNP